MEGKTFKTSVSQNENFEKSLEKPSCKGFFQDALQVYPFLLYPGMVLEAEKAKGTQTKKGDLKKWMKKKNRMK